MSARLKKSRTSMRPKGRPRFQNLSSEGWQPTVLARKKVRAPRAMGLKYLTNNNVYIGTNAGTITDLSLLPVGAAQSQREGNIVNVTSLQVKSWFSSNAYAAASLPGSINSMRCVIFQWLSPSVPVGGDILEDSLAYPTVRGYNQDKAGLYHILWDEGVVLEKAGVSAASPFGGVDSTWTKLNVSKVYAKQPTIRYDTADATGATGHNKIYMCLYTNTNTAEDKLNMIASIKLNYRD